MQAEHEIPWEEMVVKARPLGFDFMTGQMEAAPTTGTRHWHFVVHTREIVRRSAVIRAFGLGTNVEPITPGTEDRVITYVTKEDTRVCGPYVEGARPVRRNSATDWDRVRDAARAGDFDSIPSNILVSHYSNLKAINKDHVSDNLYFHHTVRGIWLHGGSGLGKSHLSSVLLPRAFGKAYYKPGNKWWCGYRQRTRLVRLEDLDLSHSCLLHKLKEWGDKHGLTGETKGGAVALDYWCMVITSNHHPDSVFSSDEDGKKAQITSVDREAVRRRFPVYRMVGTQQDAELGLNLIHGPDGTVYTVEQFVDHVVQLRAPLEFANEYMANKYGYPSVDSDSSGL